MGRHASLCPLASDPGSRARGSWLGTVLDVPTTSTPCLHENPQRQVILTCPWTQQLSLQKACKLAVQR